MARSVAVITGTRAEFGLLTPVMRAIEQHPDLELLVVAVGMHLVGERPTIDEVRAKFPVACEIPMQVEGESGRISDAIALARGIDGIARFLSERRPDWILVLGDRIEAFAGACAGAVAGTPVAHMHGGDRAEGVADEAMRHAITKLAHLHLPATMESADRIARMGEDLARITVVGSPAADTMMDTPELDDAQWEEMGAPSIVILHHPIGRDEQTEYNDAAAIFGACDGERILWLAPNRDPGWEGIARARRERAHTCTLVEHLEHHLYRGLLKRMARAQSVLVGNSSSGLIEATVAGCSVVNVGVRQGGRERGKGVVDASGGMLEVRRAIEAARAQTCAIEHPFGVGDTGERVAEVLGRTAPGAPGFVRKRSMY